ncbi:unnamed protein product [Phytophthora fragariaefolia]|uniref:Unnamed protein product n=1 Tax=Phytophthora fragariaefolia TaxID=1490495 RepID=A0A9W6YME2_9STRA|nr:unnamed protein product [Phytophthora fragariaefolia]
MWTASEQHLSWIADFGEEWMQRGKRKRYAAPVDFIEGIGGLVLDVMGVWTFAKRNTFGQTVQLDACSLDGFHNEFLIGVEVLKQHRVTMDFERNEMRYNEMDKIMVMPSRTDDCKGNDKIAVVRLVNRVQLRRRTVVPIKQSGTAPDGEEGVLVPTRSVGPVMLTTTVTKVKTGRVLVLAIHVHGDKRELPGRRELGV